MSEGIDVKGLDGCIVMRPLNTISLFQSIGRVIRLGKNKTCGYVCLPYTNKTQGKYCMKVMKQVNSVFYGGETPSITARKYNNASLLSKLIITLTLGNGISSVVL